MINDKQPLDYEPRRASGEELPIYPPEGRRGYSEGPRRPGFAWWAATIPFITCPCLTRAVFNVLERNHVIYLNTGSRETLNNLTLWILPATGLAVGIVALVVNILLRPRRLSESLLLAVFLFAIWLALSQVLMSFEGAGWGPGD